LAVGLGVAAVVYIKDHRPDAQIARVGKADKKKSRGTEPPDTEAGDSGTEDSAKSYAFYDMLPKFEVVVPEKDKDVRPDVKSVPETRRGTYVLQAGSYKNFADADRVRAQLALQGIESRYRKCPSTTIPGTGSASVRFPSWTSSTASGKSCARRTWTCW